MSEDEIKKQLGSLASRAKEALDEVREAVIRTSQIGKLKLDATFLRREQGEALRRLGEKVFELVEDGELRLPEEAEPFLAQVRSLGKQIKEQEEEMTEVESEK